MVHVGKHSGVHTAERTAAEPESLAPEATPRRTMFLLALVVTVTLVAWGVLVYAAIDFGREARSGEPTAWLFLVVTTLGAAAALFVTLILGARIMTIFRGRNEPTPPPVPEHAAGGRRRKIN
jgi:RsiW-degrading membrane proteinase PrsW (M82 family)